MGSLTSGGAGFWIIYIVLFGAIIYFFSYRPQKKAKKEQEELMKKMAIGDSVKTSSGMYGEIIDINEEEDMVIVEFGGSKNCRIPMDRSAIVAVEKAEK